MVALYFNYVCVWWPFYFSAAEGVVTEGEKGLDAEKPSGEDAAAAVADGDKEASQNEVEEKEPEDKVKRHIRLHMNFVWYAV